MRIPHQEYIDAFFNTSEGTEYRTLLMHGRRGHLETFLKMLGEQQADEHHAALSAMDDPDTIFDSYAGVLCAARLAGEYRVDTASTLFLLQVGRHRIIPFSCFLGWFCSRRRDAVSLIVLVRKLLVE